MNKKCLVLGGGSDIGSAIVKALFSDGYDVSWTYFNTKRDQPGTALKCDLRDMAQVADLMQHQANGINLLVTASFPFIESDNLDFAGYEMVEKFLRAHVYVMCRAAALMGDGGRIINILGQCVERGLAGGSMYSAAFAFLHNLGNSVNAREGKAGKTQVCDLLCGPVDTREWDGLAPEVIERYKAKVSKFIPPEVVAKYVRIFASASVMPSTFKLDAYYGY